MTVLVTGANGFVGKSLCGILKMHGYNVRGAVRNPCAGIPGQVVVGAIGSDTSWDKALAGEVDVVIHLAARVHIMNDTASDPYSKFYEVNVAGTLNLARQVHGNGVKRFIYLSSIKVNGEETFDTPFTEMDKPCPQDDYGRSKYEAEQGLFALSQECGMEVVIIRPPLVYGPGVKANFLKMMHIVAKGIPLPFGAIENKRSLVSLNNLVDLMITCIEHPAAANQVFLAGDGEDLSTTELLQRLGTALGKPARLLPVPQRLLTASLKVLGKGDMAQRLCGSLQVDISKARDLLGGNPPITVDEGLKKTAEWYVQDRLKG